MSHCNIRSGRPQSSYSSASYDSSRTLTNTPVRSYRDVFAQAYIISSTRNGVANKGVSPISGLNQSEQYYSDNRKYIQRGNGDRLGEDEKEQSIRINKRKSVSGEAENHKVRARTEHRHAHRHNTSVDSVSTIANSVPIVANPSVKRCNCSEGRTTKEKDPGYMMTWPTISERICVRWASQPNSEPHVGEMNKISEPTCSWLLTSMKHFYIDLRILHPWLAQQCQQNQQLQVNETLGPSLYQHGHDNELAADYQRYNTGMARLPYEGGLAIDEGGLMNSNVPLFAGNQQFVFPGRPITRVASSLNPITSGTLIEHMSAGHYRRSDEKVDVSSVTDIPISVPSHNIDVTWSEWINGEPGRIDTGNGVSYESLTGSSARSWQNCLGAHTTKLEYEGSATFRIIGREINPFTYNMCVYQEGWKVVPVATMPVSSRVSLSTSSRGVIDRYKASRHRRISSNQSSTTNSSRDFDRSLPTYQRPSSKLSSDATLRSMSNKINNISRTGSKLIHARTCIVLCHENSSLEARGMVIRVGDHCQGVLRIGDHVTVERWQWYPGAAKSAASLNAAAKDETAACKNRSKEGTSDQNNDDDKGQSRYRGSIATGIADDGSVVIGDASAEAEHAQLLASPTMSTATLLEPQLKRTTPTSTPAPTKTPAPTSASIAATTDTGAGWTRELRIGRSYMPCSIAFGVSAAKIREGTLVNFMDMVWEVAEVFNW